VSATGSGQIEVESELIYQWAITSPTPLLFGGGSPDIYFSGRRTVSSAPDGLSYAAINVAALDYTGEGEELEGANPLDDTDVNHYREDFAGCGGYGSAEKCGTSQFTIRGMYSVVNPRTIGGYVQLRAVTNGGSAFIDPALSFSDAFRANNPDAVLLFSAGITNATAAVPEPAAWATMVAGLAVVGAAKRRRKVAVNFS
jgi:hypothetical protein